MTQAADFLTQELIEERVESITNELLTHNNDYSNSQKRCQTLFELIKANLPPECKHLIFDLENEICYSESILEKAIYKHGLEDREE